MLPKKKNPAFPREQSPIEGLDGGFTLHISPDFERKGEWLSYISFYHSGPVITGGYRFCTEPNREAILKELDAIAADTAKRIDAVMRKVGGVPRHNKEED